MNNRTDSSQPRGPLAILDWGIGGLGLVKALGEQGVSSQILYFSDAGYVPYGRVSPSDLKQRLGQWNQKAYALGATHLVIACNAASSALDHPSVQDWQHTLHDAIPMTGIIAHGLEMIRTRREKRVGVIGGERTIRSGAYGRVLRSEGYRVYQRIAQPLSALVEAGQLSGAHVESVIEPIISPIPRQVPILLACTHYPALLETLHAMYPRRIWLDPISALGEWLSDGQGSNAHLRVWTTGTPDDMRENAERAFKVNLPSIQPLCLDLELST